MSEVTTDPRMTVVARYDTVRRRGVRIVLLLFIFLLFFVSRVW